MKQKLRTLIVLGTLISWAGVAISGVILYFAAKGPGLGRAPIFFGMTRGEIISNHPTIGLIAVGFTILHVIMEWRIFWVLFKNLLKGK